jgi:hypothetical protein
LSFQDSFLVSGYEFFILSKQSFCPRYQNKNEILEENDLVFVNLDSLDRFLDKSTKGKSSFSNPQFRLKIHNTSFKQSKKLCKSKKFLLALLTIHISHILSLKK